MHWYEEKAAKRVIDDGNMDTNRACKMRVVVGILTSN